MAHQSELAQAAADGNIALANRLISAGHPCDQFEPNGMTVLSIASFWGYTDMCRILIQNGANPNKCNSGNGWTPLHCAAFQGHGPVIMILLQGGADPSIQDTQQRSASDFASAIDAVWPLFNAVGCKKTPKHELIEKKIIIKLDKNTTTAQRFRPTSRGTSRPTSAYVLAHQSVFSTSNHHNDQRLAAAMSGDVLSNSS